MHHALQMQVGDVIKEINGINLDYKRTDEGGWVWLSVQHLGIMWTSCDGV